MPADRWSMNLRCVSDASILVVELTGQTRNLSGPEDRGPLAQEAESVRGTFETDPISALGLALPVSIGPSASVAAALTAVQEQGQGYVLIVDDGRPRGIMTEREVLMKIVA